MSVERSAGLIIFRKTPQGRRYLVVRSSRKFPNRPEFWDVPKGVLEKGETGLDAALRETKEEVSISNPEIIKGFKATARYFTRRSGKPVPKFVALFLARVKSPRVALSWEHDTFLWLPFEEAKKHLSLAPIKKALEEAEAFLNTHGNI